MSVKEFTTDYDSTKMLTNHGTFGSYLKRFHISDKEECNCGEGIDDSNHRLYDCILYEEHRQE